MSKKHRKISLVFIGFLLTLLTIVSFAEAPEAPNQLITENPYKEVKTVEANKNREHAEMKISVNKLNINEIEGIINNSNEIEVNFYNLKKEEEYLKERKYKIYQNLEKLSDDIEMNKKNMKISEEKIEGRFKDDILYIKNYNVEKNIYIVKFDTNQEKNIEKIWKINVIEPKANYGHCYVEIANWNVIKKYMKLLNTPRLLFYLGNNNGRLKVTNVDNPNYKTALELLPNEFQHIHTGSTVSMEDGCFKYSTGSYIRKENGTPLFGIEKGGTFYKHWRPLDTTGTLGTLGYIADAQFLTEYPMSIMTTGLTIAKDSNGYDGRFNHIVIYQLLLGQNSVDEAIQKIDNELKYNNFLQKFGWTIRGLSTRVYHDDVTIKINKDNMPNTGQIGQVDITYKNPVFQGGAGTSGSLSEESFFGRVRIFPGENIRMLSGSNSFNTFSGDRGEQYNGLKLSKNTLIPIDDSFVDDTSEVTIKIKIDGIIRKQESIVMLISNKDKKEGPIHPVYASAGSFQVMVDLPSIKDSKGGVDIGIEKDDGEGHQVEIEMFYPRKNIKNIINIEVPQFDALIHLDKIKLPSNIENDILKGEVLNFVSGNIENFNIETKNYDISVLPEDPVHSTSALSIKIPKKINLILEDSNNRQIELLGNILVEGKNLQTKIIDSLDSYYISPLFQDRKLSTNMKANIKLNVDISKVLESNDFTYPLKLYSKDNKFCTIGNKYDENSFKTFIDGINYTLNIEKENRGVTINLDNPIVSGTYGAPLGRIRVYSNSSSLTPLMGYLDTNDEIITTGIKNNQYKLGNIKGNYIPVIPNELGGDALQITIDNGNGNKTFNKTLNLNASEHFNGMMSTVYHQSNGIEVGVDYQQSSRSNYATDISLRRWDLEAKNITIKVKHPLIENNFNVTIPEFDGEVYYNKNIAQVAPTEVNYPTKTLRGRFIREHSGQMGIKFNVGTKDYDLRILGQYNGNTNLKLKIPKQVTLKVRDDLGVEKEIPFYTEILTLNSRVKGENSNYYCIFAPNDGINNNSEINATIVLKTLFKNSNVSWNYITGENLNLVSIGANSTSGEKNFTIIDNVDLKMELANFNETIDVSNVNISQKVYSKNGYYGLIQNENKLILKDGTRKILETTFEELTKAKKEISEAGVSIKYNYGSPQDINRNQFEFEKIKEINYNKTLRLEIHTSNGQLLYYIDFKIINKVEFEILPEKGKLDFGYFFPGDVKKAESLIEFKNPNNANINISLSPTNNYKMFKKGASISPNTIILLNDLQIKDLKKGANSTNNFKISGIATTTKDTLPGEYSGELDVIITIVP